MINTIYANWCYFDNFGDALNPYILSRLSGKCVKYCNCAYSIGYLWNEVKNFCKSLIAFKKYDIRRLFPVEKNKPVVLAIGSILNCALPNYLIWGAGFMNESQTAIGGKVFAVRGKYSELIIKRLGFVTNGVYGDPALLLPLIYLPNINKSSNIGIIPHWSEYDIIKNKYPYLKVISLATQNIESVIDSIISCEYIVSTSLHGVIVSHSYNIPAIWVKRGDIGTDGLKFRDYFSSVGINEYDGSLYSIDDFVGKSYSELSSDIKSLMMPKRDIIVTIQKGLLRNCPFELSNEYKVFATS